MTQVQTPVPTAEQFAAAIASAQEAKNKAAAEKAAKEAAEWEARSPALVGAIRLRIEKALKKDHPNGATLKVALPGDEYRLIHEHCVRGVAPAGLNVEETKLNHLMTTGRSLAGVQFVPDLSGV
jgi:acyl-CoA reductase-like NAD-dependent aldehyde dehydrogenase